jgi:hypothetical protein
MPGKRFRALQVAARESFKSGAVSVRWRGCKGDLRDAITVKPRAALEPIESQPCRQAAMHPSRDACGGLGCPKREWSSQAGRDAVAFAVSILSLTRAKPRGA